MGAELAYQAYEAGLASLAPARAAAGFASSAFRLTQSIWGDNPFLKASAAPFELFDRMTRRYPKPPFGISSVDISGGAVAVNEERVLELPFCTLLKFSRSGAGDSPRLLLVAPMSGHHATLLRDTVSRLLRSFDVYVTDWRDARDVPLSAGAFGLDDYVSYVTRMLEKVGPGASVMAVCQPAVPVLAAVALMSEDGHACTPKGMALLGGPIDTRISPTEVDLVAVRKGFQWFRDNAISVVPWPHRGAGRRVYPGYAQLAAFMSMNPGRHASAHLEMLEDLAFGDGKLARRKAEFYDEYLAVMDMTEEFYLDTIRKVFLEHHLPRGILSWRGRPVRPEAITGTSLITVEGGRDDITGAGQTMAAQYLCSSLPASMRALHTEPEAGHYGIFSGSRWRESVAPAIESFLLRAALEAKAAA
ncbi:MAG: polyhydroxyalkanoate depolymerase [Mesorhizobium sp.]|nr:MAG: polyhydroxyalkanoate depolymerase [Mesorhizobium sp.]